MGERGKGRGRGGIGGEESLFGLEYAKGWSGGVYKLYPTTI